jgi:hypothetical protein
MATIDPRATTRTPAQLAALIFGVVYLLVGVVGWFVTNDFTGVDDDADLLGFHLNGAHNVVHLALGAVWIAASTRLDWARAVNILFGSVLIVVCVAGLTGVLDELLNIEDAAEPDNYLHLGTGIIALYFGTIGALRRT